MDSLLRLEFPLPGVKGYVNINDSKFLSTVSLILLVADLLPKSTHCHYILTGLQNIYIIIYISIASCYEGVISPNCGSC